jgi:hypothetical protein
MAAARIGAEAAPAAARPTPLKAAGMLAGAVALIGGYLALCALLGNAEYYAGFVFLVCWTALEHGRLARLPHTLLGAALGIGLGYALHWLLASPLGVEGGYVFGLLVLPLIYCQLMGWIAWLVNFTTMVFLTVVTIPYIQAHADFGDMFLGLLAGTLYFGLVLGAAERLQAGR